MRLPSSVFSERCFTLAYSNVWRTVPPRCTIFCSVGSFAIRTSFCQLFLYCPKVIFYIKKLFPLVLLQVFEDHFLFSYILLIFSMFCQTTIILKFSRGVLYKLTGALIVARLFKLLISVSDHLEISCQHGRILEIN